MKKLNVNLHCKIYSYNIDILMWSQTIYKLELLEIQDNLLYNEHWQEKSI